MTLDSMFRIRWSKFVGLLEEARVSEESESIDDAELRELSAL